MKLENLKDWDKLTKKEQKRLREVYGEKPKVTRFTGSTKRSEEKAKKEAIKHG